MASNIEKTKELKDLNEKEAAMLLENIKCKTVTNMLLSGEYGEITGEVLEELDDETLQSIGIDIPFQRKQFLKSIERYKARGISINLLSDETLGKKIPETNETTIIDDKARLHALMDKSNKISEACTSEMDIYAFPAKKVHVNDLQQPLYGMNLKKIIIMGETGTGKSTLLNAFINYAVGVKMEDTFRFKIVVDEDDRADDQTVSQTSEISGYFIEDTLLDFSIQIWDTPGFGDTRGIERDEVIKEQINELLKLEDYCHAVCFVVKANANRLTDTQKYIIDRVLLFFGKEAQANIYILATFADDTRPDVLQALGKYNNFPFDESRWIAFNNGSLFKPASTRTSFSKTCWESAGINMERIFDWIGKVHPFSLASTKEVIAQREKLTQNLNEITDEACGTTRYSDLFTESLSFLESQEHTDGFKKTGTFTERKSSIGMSLISTDRKNMICMKCKKNCHVGCRKIGIVFCHMFDWNYKCSKCKCHLIHHDKVCSQYEEIVDTYDVIHSGGRAEYKQVLTTTKEQRDKENSKLTALIEMAQLEIQKINKIAMVQGPTSLLKYFKHRIKREEEAENPKGAEEVRKLFGQEKLVLTLAIHGDEILDRIKDREETNSS